jgi:hypothetical protein
LSAYSIYQEESPLERRVNFTNFLNHLFSIWSFMYIAVASPSIFGFVAIIISTFSLESEILLNSPSKFKSHMKTQLIGEILHQSM